MKGDQCYELFGGIAFKNHAFSFSFFNEAYHIAKLSVYFVFVQTKKQPNYVVRSLWTAWLSEVIIKDRLINI